MAFPYLEFHGRSDENIEEFLESMEVACISNHVHAPAQMLRLLQICLKGNARTWSKGHEEGLQKDEPPVELTLENLRQALTAQFVKTEDPDKVWQEIQELRQREAQRVNDYNKKFSLLWENFCEALQPQGAPLDMMKKDKVLGWPQRKLTLESRVEEAKNI